MLLYLYTLNPSKHVPEKNAVCFTEIQPREESFIFLNTIKCYFLLKKCKTENYKIKHLEENYHVPEIFLPATHN